MADISIEKGKDRADLTWVWALAAIVAIGALMLWLFVSRPTETAVVTESDTADVAEAPAGEAVDLTLLASTPDQYVGRQVRVVNVPVTAQLGPRAFWTQPQNLSPFLVVVGPEVTDVTWLTEGSAATLEGTVQPVTEADLDRLVTEQALLPEGRSQAVFATHYLAVARANP
jgi:hypothetical protein